MKNLALGMIIGGVMGSLVSMAAQADFDPATMQKNTNKMVKRAKRKMNRAARNMGIF